jgi:hypothetical protein
VKIISASSGDDTIAWYENDGQEIFTKRGIDATLGSGVDEALGEPFPAIVIEPGDGGRHK